MIEVFVAAIGALGSICAAGVAAFLANQARNNTKAVSNGFADHTTEQLAALRADIAVCNELIMHHIEAHADAELRKS